MDFSTIGSISQYAKSMALKTQWEIKKQSSDVTSHSKSLNDLLGAASSADAEKEHTNDDKLSEIMQKVYSGKKLDSKELEYLQAKSPELYQKVRDMEQEHKSYENELKNCKTKEDVQRVKMSHIGKSLATVKSVENNPNITMEKKLETAQLENARANGIEARTEAFVHSASYNALPTEAEQAEERQERIHEIKDKFTSGDTGGRIRELSQEEAAQRREELRNKPITLSVSADEITSNRFSETRDNVTYDVEGVSFTNSEMTGLKEIAKSAASMLPKMGSDLDYNAYASMGLAVNMVRTYAAEHLTEEQATVAVKGMESYVDRLTNAQRTTRQDGPTAYYVAGNTVTDAAADALRRKIAELPGDHSTLLKNLSIAQANGGMGASASNKELSGNIRDDFSKVDLRDKLAVKSLLDNYRSKVTPAYREWGLDDKGHDTSLASKLTNDTELFSNQIAGILSLLDKAKGIAVDYYA